MAITVMGLFVAELQLSDEVQTEKKKAKIVNKK